MRTRKLIGGCEISSSAGPRPRRARRLASGSAIRDAAASLFLARGYSGTSMEDIAAAAQVSKQTIYTHFANKEALFADLVLGNTEQVEGFVAGIREAVEVADGIEEGLRRLARRYIRIVIRPEVLRLRRLVLCEAGRFPELASTYYERVPERTYTALAEAFRAWQDRGWLRVPDPLLAARHFGWLVLGTPLDRGMFYPVESAANEVDVDATADAAVDVFLAAYAAPPRSGTQAG